MKRCDTCGGMPVTADNPLPADFVPAGPDHVPDGFCSGLCGPTGLAGSAGPIFAYDIVQPAEVYQPSGLVLTPWFKRWALKCGYCGKDWHFFRIVSPVLLPVRCPYCRTRNRPIFNTVGY